jgi:hypothetical protein
LRNLLIIIIVFFIIKKLYGLFIKFLHHKFIITFQNNLNHYNKTSQPDDENIIELSEDDYDVKK